MKVPDLSLSTIQTKIQDLSCVLPEANFNYKFTESKSIIKQLSNLFLEPSNSDPHHSLQIPDIRLLCH